MKRRNRGQAPISFSTLRALLIALAAALPAAGLAQTPPRIDLLRVALAKPFPVTPPVAATAREGSLPFYTFTAPMPQSSPLAVFPEYDVDAMFDTGNVYALHAKRTFVSGDACAEAFRDVVPALKTAYRLKEGKSRPSQFQASAGDIVVEAYCGYTAGSPYPTLTLHVTSKAESRRVSEQLRKRPGG